KVKIMTMHAVKGLEFPIVFQLGGLSQKSPAFSYFHFYEKGNVHYDLLMDNNANYIKHLQETEEEERRLLYVALTRAQYKLYLPKFIKYTANNIPYSTCGATSVYVQDSLQKAWPAPVCNNIVRHITPDGKDIKTEGQDETGTPLWQEWKAEISTVQETQETNAAGEPVQEENSVDTCFPQPQPHFFHRAVTTASFTSLHNKRIDNSEPAEKQEPPDDNTGNDTVYGESSLRIPDEPGEETIAGDDGAESPDEKYRDLPRGEKTGSMLHEIFEEIDFDLVNRAESAADLLSCDKTAKIIDIKMKKFRLYRKEDDPARAWRDTTAEYIFNTLKAPIFGDDFRLCQLKESDKIHELEFWYPYPCKGTGDNIAKAGIHYDEKGYLSGFIDLIFKRDNQWYILDWKSNFLEKGYDPAGLKQSMKDANYLLQYRIYIIALCRWLRQCGQTFNFGGVLYLYLRGINANDNKNGIYLDTSITEEECLADVKHILGASCQ
ncbi:MAG: PD-(D/E)XK nuclease family protein, partial [Fibrobacteria bacterium]|nr:PD-(D/E)XK nuclease family protein [Fibrobacteria bacterium]